MGRRNSPLPPSGPQHAKDIVAAGNSEMEESPERKDSGGFLFSLSSESGITVLEIGNFLKKTLSETAANVAVRQRKTKFTSFLNLT